MEIIDLRQIHSLSTNKLLKKLERFLKSIDFKNKRILFVCEDMTRSLPVKLFFPYVLRYVKKKTQNITVLFALGTHRLMTRKEMFKKLGISAPQASNIKMVNHSPNDDSHLVAIGKINKVTYKTNKEIINHDLIIGISNTLPHKVMGFSGGVKLLCVGTGNKEFIDYSHTLSNSFKENQIVTKINNPMRDLLNKTFHLLQKKVKAQFYSLNFVATPEKIVDTFCGRFISAYQLAARKSYETFIKKVEPCQSILAILDPKSLDFWQAAKAVYNCAPAIKRNGSIVLAGLLPEGISPIHGKIIEKFGYQKESQIKKLMASGKLKNVVVASHMIRVARCLDRIKVIISSKNIDEKTCKKINFGYLNSSKISLEKFDYVVYNPIDITLIPIR